ncbi:Hint domain-containing protein [Pseudoprimorskyibacter insulae]|uniref:Hedgehog/Intein (Hint) domain-containing protein n=1 Tax=Pseudoprimorskyibacter insulae TaxID=1695997 RepID=A0A2R8ANR8_9RHOB|nr:Hint domain-containing protein [Pseudoprimorskyibacter insulae]SPF77691.1 hypothetical protein PRI8871_00275 [Pseudoprimorskyibacter insulae]
MGFVISAQNNQFSTATGANVNIVPGSSRFDAAPSTTSNLTITTKDADLDPRSFNIGATYDLQYTNSSGTVINVVNAGVARSDAVGAGGIVVFSGQDQFGGTVHLIWAPDFDLQGWYNTNYSEAAPPQFFNTDQNAAYTHTYICFAGSTQICTPDGLVKAGQLRVGMEVSTWNGPPRPIKWLGRRRVSALGPSAPVHFATGSIGNHAPLRLSQQHRVMIRVPRNSSDLGVTELLVPAKELVNGKSITIRSGGEITYVHILLDRHDLVIAEGSPCESLLPGPEAKTMLQTSEDRSAFHAAVDNRAYHPVRPLLSGKAARRAGRSRVELPEKRGNRAI